MTYWTVLFCADLNGDYQNADLWLDRLEAESLARCYRDMGYFTRIVAVTRNAS